MRRNVLLSLSVVLLACVGVARAQDAITVKIYKDATGDRSQTDLTTTETLKMKISDGTGKVLKEDNNKTVLKTVYKETVLAKEGHKPATKLEREYTKAEIDKSNSGKFEKLPYDGKTIVIEKKGDKYTFTYKGGKELTAMEAETLVKEFKDKKDDDKDMDKLLLPSGPVKVGDTWKIDTKELLKDFEKDAGIEGDLAKATGTGKLVKAYKKDGKQYGEVSVTVDIPLKSVGKDNDKLTFTQGKMTIVLTFDGCIDGTAGDGKAKIKMTMAGKATHPMLPGGEVLMDAVMEQEGTTMHLKK